MRIRLPCVPVALALAGSLLLVAGVIACGGSPATTSPAAGAALTVAKDTQTKTFTVADLKKLKAAEGYGGIMNSVGTITAPSKIKGVSVAELLSQVGGLKETDAVKVEAKDGYAMTFPTPRWQKVSSRPWMPRPAKKWPGEPPSH